jgi:hypothetical protein
LCRRKQDADLRNDYRIGVLASIVANLTRGKEDKPAEPADFFPGLPKSKPQVQSSETQMAFISGLVESQGGTTQVKVVDRASVDAEFEEARLAFERVRTGGTERSAG